MKNKSGHDKSIAISRAGIIHLLPLILVTGVVLAAIGGIFYFNQSGDQPLIVNSEPIIEDSDYTEYVNYDLGFKILYPNYNNEVTPYEPKGKTSVSFCREGTDSCSLFVKVYTNQTITEVYEEQISIKDVLVSFQDLEEVNIDSQIFNKAYIEYLDSKSTYYYIKQGSDTYVIVVPWHRQDHDNILSSFEFIEDKKNSWNFFESDNFKLGLRYPDYDPNDPKKNKLNVEEDSDAQKISLSSVAEYFQINKISDQIFESKTDLKSQKIGMYLYYSEEYEAGYFGYDTGDDSEIVSKNYFTKPFDQAYLITAPFGGSDFIENIISTIEFIE